MTKEPQHLDIDERAMTDASLAMESLAHLETMLEQSGFEDGRRDGRELGRAEGFDLGTRIGTKTARELGFYLGATQWLLRDHNFNDNANTNHSQKYNGNSFVNERAAKVLRAILAMIDSFPHSNDHSLDIVPLLEKIRAKFRLATVLLKMKELLDFDSIDFNAVASDKDPIAYSEDSTVATAFDESISIAFDSEISIANSSEIISEA
ncbi:hypothetical protein HK100_009659, partial [Physocladia obscura]